MFDYRTAKALSDQLLQEASSTESLRRRPRAAWLKPGWNESGFGSAPCSSVLVGA
jgi:hypothetical protein